MQELTEYKKSINNLVRQFYKIYYYEEGESIEEDYDYYVDINIDKRGMHYINISDDFLDLNDIYIALLNEIPKETFFKWFSYQLDWHIENETGNPTNLYNYNKLGL